MNRVSAKYDASRLLRDRPIRIEVPHGLHSVIVERISVLEARALIAELEGALLETAVASSIQPELAK